jgi:hypothetical protein
LELNVDMMKPSSKPKVRWSDARSAMSKLACALAKHVTKGA